MRQNEYGADLDRNGYARSIIWTKRTCYLCWRRDGKLDRHEIFGASNRTKSKNYGLWVPLCRGCHEKAHSDKQTAVQLKKAGQLAAEDYYNWDIDRFRAEFGKSYI